MKIKDLILKYGFEKIEGFIDISKHPEINIDKNTFDFLKDAQLLLSEVKKDYAIAIKLFRKQGEKINQGNETRLLPQWWKLQENYQKCLIRNNLLLNINLGTK